MKKKKHRMRRKRILFLLSEILILSILLSIGYVIRKYDKFQVMPFEEGEIEVNKGAVQEGYTTVALFGGDSREGALEEGTHADCMIIASIDNQTKEVRLTSVYRDMLTEQVSGAMKKANYAYFTGGPKDALNMLNKNLDLDIQNYVTVDFKALADTIDLLGGIEIEITEEEVPFMNEFLAETAQVAKKEAKEIKQAGNQLLDGTQAVTYARIRSTAGGDYKRTERQRVVLQKIFEKAIHTKLSTINKIINTVFPQVSTSFTLKDIIGLAAGATQYKLVDAKGFPFELTDGPVEGVGSTVIPVGLVENVQELHAFLYPKDTYSVSEKVIEISGKIETMTGVKRSEQTESEE